MACCCGMSWSDAVVVAALLLAVASWILLVAPHACRRKEDKISRKRVATTGNTRLAELGMTCDCNCIDGSIFAVLALL